MDKNLSDQKPQANPIPTPSVSDPKQAKPFNSPVQAPSQPAPSSPPPPSAPPMPSTSTPPAVTPPSKVPPETTKKSLVKKDINFLNAFLMVLGPLFMVGSFGFSFYNLKLKPQTPGIYVVDSGVEINTADDYHKYAPDNPTEVRAYADESKQIELQSGQEYSYDNPYFEWSGAKTNEPKTEIVGYWVTLGDNHSQINPSPNMIYTEENHYSPKEHGLTLERGKTYKFFVQAVSNGKAPLGVEKNMKKSVVARFEYIYK